MIEIIPNTLVTTIRINKVLYENIRLLDWTEIQLYSAYKTDLKKNDVERFKNEEMKKEMLGKY